MAWQCHTKNEKGGDDIAPANISVINSYDNGMTWVCISMTPGAT